MSCPRSNLADAPLCDLLAGLKSDDPEVRSNCAKEIMTRVKRVESFMSNVKAKFPKLREFFKKFFDDIQAYNEFAALTVAELAETPGCAEYEAEMLAMLVKDTGIMCPPLSELKIHNVFNAPEQHMDLDSFEDPVKLALAEHAKNEETRQAAAELTRPYDEAAKAVEKSNGAKKMRVTRFVRSRAAIFDRPLVTMYRFLDSPYPANQSKGAEGLMLRVGLVKAFLREVKEKFPNLLKLPCNKIDQYNAFAASTVTALCAESEYPWHKKRVLTMLIEATEKPWLDADMEKTPIYEAFDAPKEHVDLDSFKVRVLRALAAHASDDATRKAAADLLRVREEAASAVKAVEAEESKALKRKRDADLESEEAEAIRRI
jgi:hypothetical protein